MNIDCGPSRRRGNERRMSRWRLIKSKFLPGCIRPSSMDIEEAQSLPSATTVPRYAATPSPMAFHSANSATPGPRPSLQANIASTSRALAQLNIASQLREFTVEELKIATKSFHRNLILGEGGFGRVFKGWISHRGPTSSGVAQVAVKILNPQGVQGDREWRVEVDLLGELHHPHVIRLHGHCNEGQTRALVYEFMDRGSLEDHLFRRVQGVLVWHLRMKIVVEAARGLVFLHQQARRPIVFRDFKTSNVLIDQNWNAKLSDFGLATEGPMGNASYVKTKVMGTLGYVDPHYARTEHLTVKSDVFSFGVVLLELITGKRSYDRNRDIKNLVQYPRFLFNGWPRCQQLVDPSLQGQYPITAVLKAAKLAYKCVQPDPKNRPYMSQVLRELESLENYADLAADNPEYQPPPPANQGGSSRSQMGLVRGNMQPGRNPAITPIRTGVLYRSARPSGTPQHP